MPFESGIGQLILELKLLLSEGVAQHLSVSERKRQKEWIQTNMVSKSS